MQGAHSSRSVSEDSPPKYFPLPSGKSRNRTRSSGRLTVSIVRQRAGSTRWPAAPFDLRLSGQDLAGRVPGPEPAVLGRDLPPGQVPQWLAQLVLAPLGAPGGSGRRRRRRARRVHSSKGAKAGFSLLFAAAWRWRSRPGRRGAPRRGGGRPRRRCGNLRRRPGRPMCHRVHRSGRRRIARARHSRVVQDITFLAREESAQVAVFGVLKGNPTRWRRTESLIRGKTGDGSQRLGCAEDGNQAQRRVQGTHALTCSLA
jgi:hypothetical protein